MKEITDIDDVFASGCHAGLKKEGLDLAYIYVPRCEASAAVFTQNAYAAPCVIYNRKIFNQVTVRALVVNSENANAVTGDQGKVNVLQTAKIAAAKLEIPWEEIAIASTGIIGVQLPMDKIRNGLNDLLSSPLKKEGGKAAEAILTTDTCTKKVFLEKNITGGTLKIAGIAKGSGMIAPNMATMLSFLVTNAPLNSNVLNEVLKSAVDKSFNMCSVDTDTSTSDMVLIFSSPDKMLAQDKDQLKEEFPALLDEACISLSKQIAKDGEGAEKLIEVNVTGAKSEDHARRIAKSIVNSPLVKTAVHGADPNWGRIIMAVGKEKDVLVDPARVDCFIQGIPVLSKGTPVQFDRLELSNLMKDFEVKITVYLNLGSGEATAWGCDLTKGYIDINTKYN